MGLVNIQTALKQMDGIFGCKVSVRYEGKETTPIITFRKKNIIDFFRGFFSHDDAKIDQRCNLLLALSEIATDLGEKNDSEIRHLIKKYESNNDLIDFKEIRRTLRTSYSNQLSPMVFSRSAKEANATTIAKSRNTDVQQDSIMDVGLNVPMPKYKDGMTAENRFFSSDKSCEVIFDKDLATLEEVEKVLAYENFVVEKIDEVKAGIATDEPENRTEVPVEGTVSAKKFFPEGFSNAQSEKEDFEKRYLYRIGECIRNKTYSVELVRGVDGDVSDDNLDTLAETIISVEWLTKKPILVTIVEKDDAKFRLISDRLDSAFVANLGEQGNPYTPERVIDLETVKREVETSRIQSQHAPLDMRIAAFQR